MTNTTKPDQARQIPIDELPATIRAFLPAHRERDVDTAMAFYADDATVTDEGRTYSTPGDIRDWMGSSASEYTYTTELIAARRIDDEHYGAVHHLEGDFPGGVADLQFRFALRGDRISQLTIAP
jgi:hypothetical protein